MEDRLDLEKLLAKPDNPPTTPTPASDGPPELPGAFSLFSPSTKALTLNLGPLLALICIPVVALVLIIFLDLLSNGGTLMNIISILVGLVAMVFSYLIIVPSITYLQVQSAREQQITLTQAVDVGKGHAVKMFGLAVILSLIIGIGLILLIIPGIILLKRYYLATYYLVDKDLSISEAMKASVKATTTYSAAVWSVIGVMILLSLVAIVPIIGLFFAVILHLVYSFAPALRYTQIEKRNVMASTSWPTASPVTPSKSTAT